MDRRLMAVVAGATLVAGLAACGSDEQTRSDGRLTVVASTDVWGSVVGAVGGPDVTVTSIVSGTGADPHSHQVSAKDAATLRDADLVVSNGGGYDEFVDQALEGGGAGPARIVAFEVHENADHSLSTSAPAADATTAPAPAPSEAPSEPEGPSGGEGHSHEGANEHVWYDLHTVAEVADRVAHTLGELRPESSATFTTNAAAFRARLDGLSTTVAELATTHAGASVAATEPVAGLLLSEAGLVDVTPAEFVEAVEEENDPPAAAVAELQQVVAQKRVSALVHNPQTETPVVADLVEQARTAGVPVVDMTETLPDGQDYLTWMGNQITALSEALATPPTR